MQRAFLMIVLISTVTISANAQNANKQDPTTWLWLEVKKELTGPDAQRYFDEAVKDVALPTLVGTGGDTFGSANDTDNSDARW
jgi:hypothetical protein